MIGPEGQATLVEIVRAVLAGVTRGQRVSVEDPGREELNARCGCFVTYKTHGRLRGCLGCFTSDQPLWRTVAQFAESSATADPRFAGNRIQPHELGDVAIDISVLTPLAPCADPTGIELGTHGIYIRGGGRTGCFLPQVATETGWSVEEFWSNCCAHKAGLPPDAWRSGQAETFTFTAQVIEAYYAQS